jgi:Peptidase family M23
MTMNRFNFFAIMPLIAALMACGQTVPGGMGIDPNEQPNASLRAQASNATYYLPWTSGRRFQVTQGYSGGYSHGGSYALDFGLFQGDEVRSARAGEVISVISGKVNCFNTGCPSGDGGFGNYVQVYHNDDTNTLYAHLSSSAVTVGQRVNQGQLLGFAGSTGYSTAAHLHFQANNGRSWTYASTFPARFKEVSDAGNSEPVDGVSYTSQNNEVIDQVKPECNPGWTPGGAWTRQISDNDLDLSEGQGFQKLGLYPQYWWADGSNSSGGNSVYTYSGNVPDENYGKWSTYVPEGTYDAYAYIPTAAGNGDNIGGSSAFADEVKYRVQGFDGPVYNVASINQSANRGCWVKLGSGYGFTQGLRVAVQLGDQVDSAPARRIYYDDVAFYRTAIPPTPPAWTTSPTSLTFNGVVDGAIADQNVVITNVGQTAGTFASFGTNDAVFGAKNFATSLGIGASTQATFVAAKCTAVGTTTGQISFTGSGSTTTVALTRVCSPAPPPTWKLNPTALTFTAIVGSTPTNQTFTITNSGTGSGTFGMGSTNNALVTATGYNTTLAVGASTTATVLVGACTSVGQTTAQLGVDGGGSSAAVSITRICNAAPIPAPSVPSLSSITMSSNGRIFIAWPEVSGATQYDFQATFGGAAISVTGQAPNRGGVNGSAVATFLSAPDAADKQGKQVCFSMRASNTGGPSAFSSFACTTYKYYAGGLSVQSSSDVPRLTLK